jgi:hypothetical protein
MYQQSILNYSQLILFDRNNVSLIKYDFGTTLDYLKTYFDEILLNYKKKYEDEERTHVVYEDQQITKKKFFGLISKTKIVSIPKTVIYHDTIDSVKLSINHLVRLGNRIDFVGKTYKTLENFKDSINKHDIYKFGMHVARFTYGVVQEKGETVLSGVITLICEKIYTKQPEIDLLTNQSPV